MSVSCILLGQTSPQDGEQQQSVNCADIREYPVDAHGDSCEEGYCVDIENGAATFVMGAQAALSFTRGTTLATSIRYNYEFQYGAKLSEAYMIAGQYYSSNGTYTIQILDANNAQVICSYADTEIGGYKGEIYVLSETQFLLATVNRVRLFEFDSEALTLKLKASQTIGGSSYTPFLMQINETKYLGATGNSSTTANFREITVVDNSITVITRSDTLPYPISLKTIKLADDKNGYSRFLYDNGADFVYLKVNEDFDITVKTLSAPTEITSVVPLFQNSENSASFVATSGTAPYDTFLVTVENDEIYYEKTGTVPNCNLPEQVGAARGKGYCYNYYLDTTTYDSYLDKYQTWYARGDNSVGYVEAIDVAARSATATWYCGTPNIIPWNNNTIKIIGVASLYVKTSNGYTYRNYMTAVANTSKHGYILGDTVYSIGTHAIALNSASPGETVRCLFSGSTEADWAVSGWKVDTDGVRGYSPQDGIVAAQPYYWNMDNPDTITTQQDITTTSLDDIATNQLYTDLELSAIEQGQAQTDLEIMILGG